MLINRTRQAGHGVRVGNWLDGWRGTSLDSIRRNTEKQLRVGGTGVGLALAATSALLGDWETAAAFTAFATVAFTALKTRPTETMPS